MTNYSVTKGKEAFDWNRFLRNVKRRKTRLPYLEYMKVKGMAGDWVTCACGNQCSILERRAEDSKPLDDTLTTLGIHFANAIIDRKWSRAQMYLKKIEKRSSLLINQKLDAAKQMLEEAGYTVSYF